MSITMDLSVPHVFSLDNKYFRLEPSSPTYYIRFRVQQLFPNAPPCTVYYCEEEEDTFTLDDTNIIIKDNTTFVTIFGFRYKFSAKKFIPDTGEYLYALESAYSSYICFSDSVTDTPLYSVYQERPLALSNWLANHILTFFDPITFSSFVRAGIIAARKNLPLKEIYHQYLDLPWIDTTPIILHSDVTKISHMGKIYTKNPTYRIYTTSFPRNTENSIRSTSKHFGTGCDNYSLKNPTTT
jgi:hypothetical protein